MKMNFVIQMNSVYNLMMNFALKTMNFALKMMNSVLKMMNSVLKMSNLQNLIPPIVRIGAAGRITKREIHERMPAMSRELLSRVWKKRLLWFIWMDPADMTRLHYQVSQNAEF